MVVPRGTGAGERIVNLAEAATVADYRVLARHRLPRFLFDYVDGAANAELTQARNAADLDALLLRQRVGIDVGKISTETSLFGRTLAMPLVLGPVGLAGLMARRGEVQAARAARAAGIPFCLSTLGLAAIEEVEAAAPGATWFQLYMMRDRGFMRDLLARVAAHGAPVLMLTLDVPVPGIRHRDRRSGLVATGARARLRQAMQVAAHPGWLWDVFLHGRPLSFGSIAPAVPNARSFADYYVWLGRNFDATIAWDDIAFLRDNWRGAIVVKGILDPADVAPALAAGVDGIVVSNHGGRQLDGVPSTIAALPPIRDAVAGRVPIMLDGGVRSGIDVLKALSSGADACLLGRAWAYSLGAGGETGVSALLQTIAAELRTGLALAGCIDSRAAGSDLLAR